MCASLDFARGTQLPWQRDGPSRAYYRWRQRHRLPDPRSDSIEKAEQKEGQDDIPDYVGKLGRHVSQATGTKDHKTKAQPLGPFRTRL